MADFIPDELAERRRSAVLGHVNPQQVGRAGEMFVAAEIHRRGGYAVTFAGNMPGIDILASNLDDSRRISVQVKTKRTGTWHAKASRDGLRCDDTQEDGSFWVFVDLGHEHPEYFIVPRWWVRNNIAEVHAQFLERWHGKHEPGEERASDHHGIVAARVDKWRGRWDELGIF